MNLRPLIVVVALVVLGLPVLVAGLPLVDAGALAGGAPLGPVRGVAGTIGIPPEDVALLAWRAGFRDWALVEAVAIAGAESHLTSDALGDTHSIRGLLCPSHGLWQIRSCPGTPGGLDRGTRAVLVDPVANAAAAHRLFRSPRGFNHWSVYTSGAYIDWIPTAVTATGALRHGAPPPAVPLPVMQPQSPGTATSAVPSDPSDRR